MLGSMTVAYEWLPIVVIIQVVIGRAAWLSSCYPQALGTRASVMSYAWVLA